MPKNANSAKMTSMAPGLEMPIMNAWKKSLSEYEGVASSRFIFLNGSLNVRLHPRKVTIRPPPTMIRVL